MIDDAASSDAQLARLLEQRADRITPVPDLAMVVSSLEPGEETVTRSTNQRVAWLAAAAAVLLAIAGIGLFAETIAPPQERFAATSGEPVSFGQPLAPARFVLADVNLTVWMSPDASLDSIEAVARWLGSQDQVASYEYVDRASSYVEFLDFYADQPEVVSLVSADQLPASFRIHAIDPEAVERSLAGLPGVQDVDRID